MVNFKKQATAILLGTTLLFTASTGASAASYKVKSGDTLSAIAKKYNTTYTAIMKLNKLSSTKIKVGQTLKVNSTKTTSKKASTKTTTYTVKKGDSLSSIAKKYNTTYTAIMKLNGLKSTLIKVGKKLKVQSSSVTKTAAVKSTTSSSTTKTVTLAKKYLGVPYVFGGTSPSGFDCSGFIYYVFKNSGKSVGRTTAAGYYSMSKKVTSPKVGDLVFFSNTYKKGVSHIGIYIGSGKMISASGSKVQISSISSSYWKSHFTGYGRI